MQVSEKRREREKQERIVCKAKRSALLSHALTSERMPAVDMYRLHLPTHAVKRERDSMSDADNSDLRLVLAKRARPARAEPEPEPEPVNWLGWLSGQATGLAGSPPNYILKTC